MAVYLLRYDEAAGDPGRPRASARYYIGYASDENLPRRISEHRTGTSRAALPDHFFSEGIGFRVARIWWGAGRTFERRLKNNGHFNKHDSFHPRGRRRMRRGVHVRPRPEEMDVCN